MAYADFYCERCDEVLEMDAVTFEEVTGQATHTVDKSYSPVEGMGVIDGEEYHEVVVDI